jgi:hypothetical protein
LLITRQWRMYMPVLPKRSEITEDIGGFRIT